MGEPTPTTDELILRGAERLHRSVYRVSLRLDEQDGRLMVLESSQYWRSTMLGLAASLIGSLTGAGLMWWGLHVP